MFMSETNVTFHEAKSNPKQIKIPEDGQLSKKGTVIKEADAEWEIDYSISELIVKINLAGFKSRFSCSGLKKDHPFKDVKHDGAYISFLYRDNESKALEVITSAAARLNLTVEQCRISQRPAMVVRIDKDQTGCSLSDRIRTANEAGKRMYDSDGYPGGACTRELEAVLKRNGGLVYDSDEKIETVWKKFGDLLLQSHCSYAS